MRIGSIVKRLALAITGLLLSSLLAAADANKGATVYKACVACHGASATGIKALGAPKLAGQSGWYLVTQLKNFKAGIRGSHPQDTWGKAMAPMAGILSDTDVDDVVAYILTLE